MLTKDIMPTVSSPTTLLIDVSDRADSCIIVIGGRTIIEQHERDSQPTLSVGVTIHSGSFRGISGPGSCPTFGRNSVVLEVRDVELADDLAEEPGQVHRPEMNEEWAAAVERRHERRAGAGLV